ncbi:MAG: YcxB family protein [Chitinophagaceae bacterium]|nr:YcxB family protein [Chitinophagaceae bacterium]
MTIYFGYEKKQVIQALRYHFLTKPEIRIVLILINVFAIGSAILFALGKVKPIAFLLFSLMWFILMLAIWSMLPRNIYRKSQTFKDEFSMTFDQDGVVLKNERGNMQNWAWQNFTHYLESPFFFHLYFNTRSFFLVPKDAFEDITTLQEIKGLIRSKLKK